MSQNISTRSISIENDVITLETGRIARQAHGSVVVRQRNAALLVTVVTSPGTIEGLDYFPLSVEFRELFGAAGIIPLSYNRREGRSADREVLAGRVIDRTIRPLFPGGYRHETQVLATLLSSDSSIDTDVLGIMGACAALQLSPIPWKGPAAGFRVCRINGVHVINPTRERRAVADLDFVISGCREGLIMLEGHCREVPEPDVAAALNFAQNSLSGILDTLDDWCAEAGQTKIVFSSDNTRQIQARTVLESHLGDRLSIALNHQVKQERYQALSSLKNTLMDEVQAVADVNLTHKEYAEAFNELKHNLVRQRILTEKQRLDGRRPEDVRAITGLVDWVPTPHGSALFTRGETQACVTCTLGPEKENLRTQTVYGDDESSFFLHYSFPPYSVGEVKALRGPGRREIGHGTLAWKALLPVMPSKANFPYTIRVFSEITESNGSSSMATVCGGCLAVMDAGVPIRAPVAGIAMGLVIADGVFEILTDILGDEDHLGDMDFKVAGTADGVTAIQMDNKVGYLPADILTIALDRARQGINHILTVMNGICPNVRTELKPHVPRSVQITIPENKIGLIIGPSGKTIKELQSRTGAVIDISDDGRVKIYAPRSEQILAARREIESMTREPKLNGFYRGIVKSIKPFGIFVEILPGTEGLVHVSDLDNHYIDDPGSIARAGDTIPVKVIGVDERGKLKLSRKEAIGISNLQFES